MSDITAALIGLRYLRDFTKWVGDLRKDADVLTRVTEAMAKVGEVQDKLHELRDENLGLLEENRTLKDELRALEDWQKRRASYSLVKTAGGALVLSAEGPPQHYACPSCAEKKTIQVLQDMRVMSGRYRCPGCETDFLVDPPRSPPQPRYART